MKKFALLLAALVCFSASAMAEEEGFVSLFNGQDLTGWTVNGGYATYAVEDGCIIGTCAPDKPMNTFLCTDKEYGNFILKFQVKFLENGNSGCQFRSHTRPENGRNRVFGYQCEIEPTGSLCGHIYDEGRRGHTKGYVWFDTFTPQERLDASKADWNVGDWNDVEIQAVGPSIKTWINGHLVADIMDTYDMTGFIGLQVHAGKACKVAWKNIRIKDLGVSEWKSFFVKGDDGKYKLENAYFVLPQEWSFLEDGTLHGDHKSAESRDGLVISNDNYDNFAARVTYRMNGGNSALYFRAEETEAPWVLRGWQNEIANNSKDSALWHTAGIIKGKMIGGRGWVVSNDEIVEKVRNKNVPEEWNTTATIAVGDRMVQTLNGYCTSDIVDPQCEKTGKLGLQMHGGTDCEMFFKNWDYMPITPEMVELINRK